MRLYPPLATNDGTPIRGRVRADFATSERLHDVSLADRGAAPYPAADPESPENVLTVRDAPTDEREPIPRARWKFARLEDGSVLPDRTRSDFIGMLNTTPRRLKLHIRGAR